jgi:hypothetical protein
VVAYLLWAHLTLAAPPCAEVRLVAEIGADGREIRGAVTCERPRPGVLHLATYPGVLTSTAGLDDVNREWFYPDGFSAAAMTLAHGERIIEATGPWVELGESEGRDAVEVRFATHTPRRRGTFGRAGTVAYLLGGWHPSFGDGRRLEAMPVHFEIRVPPGTAGFVGRTPFGLRSARVIRGETFGRFVPVLAAPAIEIVETPAARVIMPARGPARAPADAAATHLADVSACRDRGAVDEIATTLRVGADLLDRLGVSGPAPLLVVVTPLREHLVESFDGGLAVSDRAFHLLDVERFEKLHRMSLWRGQVGQRVLPRCRELEHELPAELIADLVASALVDRLALERYGGAEYAPDLLESVAVIPEIDSLIFAPQVSFADTYFAAIDETPHRRWRLDDFDHLDPRGRLIYEKLVDWLGAAVVSDLVAAYLQDERPWLELAEQSTGRDLREWIVTWLGPYPVVDYAIAGVRSEGESVHVTVAASGPDASRLREPVVVEIEDRDGIVHRQERLGPGEVRFAAPGPPRRVEIDPDGRLVELTHPPGFGPRFNNRDPPRWRFLLNNITGLIAVTGREVTVAADFSLRRIHDQRYRWNFFGMYGPDSAGAAVTLSYGFGREVTPLVLSRRAAASLVYERLSSEGGRYPAAHQGTLQLSVGHDDRLSPYWSFSGSGLSARAGGGAGRSADQVTYGYGYAGASALGIVPLAFGHALVGRVRGDLLFGEPRPQDWLTLGDLYRAGRGFERGEARGRARAVATTEYRHLWVGDGRTDLGGLLTWTRLEGGLFADAVYLPVAEPERCARRVFADVGYGLRFIGDVLGVSPAEVTIDVGLPFGRCAGDTRRQPLTVYVGFVQSLAAF